MAERRSTSVAALTVLGGALLVTLLPVALGVGVVALTTL